MQSPVQTVPGLSPQFIGGQGTQSGICSFTPQSGNETKEKIKNLVSTKLLHRYATG